VSGETERPTVRFEPLRPATRGRLVAAFIIGPLSWLVALIVVAWVLEYTSAIALGLLVTAASFLASLLVLALVHAARRRQERRYAERG
jgi:ABC-type transport system involved in multi-copper enzyme maturation permease subunit